MEERFVSTSKVFVGGVWWWVLQGVKRFEAWASAMDSLIDPSLSSTQRQLAFFAELGGLDAKELGPAILAAARQPQHHFKSLRSQPAVIWTSNNYGIKSFGERFFCISQWLEEWVTM